MKIVKLPTRVFETGDRVLTPQGKATVVHDELENIENDMLFEDIAEDSHLRDAVIIKLDEPCSGESRMELELNRNDLVYPLEEL
jgi:hypothetical protein